MTAITARTDTANSASFRRGMVLGAIATLLLWLSLLSAVVLASWLPTAQAPAQPANAPFQLVDENHPFQRPDGAKVF